jgi:DNA polymerase-3 subunit beta
MQILKQELSAALRELTRVAPNRPHVPILAHVVLGAENNTLTLRATDLDLHLTAELPCEGDLAPTCLPLKPLAALAKPESKKDTGVVTIDLDGEIAQITADGVTSKLAALPAGDFPASIPVDDLSLVALWPAAGLRAALGYVLPAASNDVTRPHLCGVNLEGARVAATDGHRLHRAELPSAIADGMFLPTAAAAILLRTLTGEGQVVLARTESHLRARCGVFTLDARLGDVEFPDVDQVVPSLLSMPTRLMVEADAVRKAMARIGKLTDRGGFKMTVNGAVRISAGTEDGSTEFELPVVSNTHEGEDLVIGFAAKYVADAVNGSSGAAELHLGRSLDPLRVDVADGRLAVVMPMRM